MSTQDTVRLRDYKHIVFFTGAGMSAESGVPTYRGSGGIWKSYRWQDYACQAAFDRDPEKVIEFHQLRRQAVLRCQPHAGHLAIAGLQHAYPQHVVIVTQNIDGMHQRAGARDVIELHGSLWRMRCRMHGRREDLGASYAMTRCELCGERLRPDIVWFEDMLEEKVLRDATNSVASCDLLVSVGTSGVVYPAAGLPQLAKRNGAYCIEINPEETEVSALYDRHDRRPASVAIVDLFGGAVSGASGPVP
jgi:NAD-dependent deacetylase